MVTTTRPVMAVVVTFNSENEILDTVQALLASTIERVVIWDNGSTDATVDVVNDSFPEVVCHRALDNLGFGTANNRAVASYADPDHDILLVNPDCIISDTLIDCLQKTLAADSTVGITAPAMRYADGSKGIAGGGRPQFMRDYLVTTALYRRFVRPVAHSALKAAARHGFRAGATKNFATTISEAEVEVFWVSGFCALLRREAWDSVQGFDERFFLYFEDVALCHSLRLRGWKVIFNGQAEALHLESRSSTPIAKSAHYKRGMCTYYMHYGRKSERLIAKRFLEGSNS